MEWWYRCPGKLAIVHVIHAFLLTFVEKKLVISPHKSDNKLETYVECASVKALVTGN